jgi:arabinose-5-phosphate isomerase
MTAREYGIQAILDEAEALRNLVAKIDGQFDRAIEMMYSCQGKVIVTGVGKSGHIGAKIAATFSSTGTPAFFINPLDVYHGDLGVMTRDDVVLAISHSGQTDELLRFIPLLQHSGIPVIAMTGNPQSLLAKYAACHLHIAVEREACPLNLAPTSSTTAALAMGDALAIALMKKRHFMPQDFAHFHPGGELGKRLLMTAADVMRSHELPTFDKQTRLGEAIMLVSEGKLGLGVAVDNEMHVEGIITDGDIRRAIERWHAEFFDHAADDIMTHHPKTVSTDTKITEIQQLMQRYKIHSLLVVDQENRLVGVVDHYRCMI